MWTMLTMPNERMLSRNASGMEQSCHWESISNLISNMTYVELDCCCCYLGTASKTITPGIYDRVCRPRPCQDTLFIIRILPEGIAKKNPTFLPLLSLLLLANFKRQNCCCFNWDREIEIKQIIWITVFTTIILKQRRWYYHLTVIYVGRI